MLVLSFGPGLPTKRFPGPGIQCIGNGLNLSSTPSGQVRSLREVLPKKAIRVFVCATLPRAVRVSKEDLHTGLDR